MAVTGVSGTIGHGLLPFLEEDSRITRVIGIGSRSWDPTREGYTKVEYREADVRDLHALQDALAGADAAVHLAFSLYGVRQGLDELKRINVEGSRNVLAAALEHGVERFVYTSSAAVYGFGGERSQLVDESAEVDPAPRHFYSQHKAEVERALLAELSRLPRNRWVFFRPCAVVGPHAAGAAGHAVPKRFAQAAGGLATVAAAAGLRPFVPGPPVPLQFVHERDVGQAIHRALVSDDAGGIYNLGADGMVAPADVPRLLGLRTLPLPGALTRAAFTAVSRLPYVRPALGWSHLLTRPLELDSGRARRELGWLPEFGSAEALASTRRALAI